MDAFTLRLIRERNAQNNGHWFEPATLRFFRSRLPQGTVGRVDNTAWFVTSEQPPHGARRYTVRRANVETGSVETEGTFLAYASRSQALAAAKACVRAASAAYRAALKA